jgi:uncharacterized protein YbjT (DUF2867 family)
MPHYEFVCNACKKTFPIGSELAKELTSRNEPIRLVSRNPKLVPGAAEAVAADLSNLDDTVAAVSGSRVAYLLVGLKYDISVWQALWPRIMRNAIEACKRANADWSSSTTCICTGKWRA